jgi:diguanylate cyclase (GGDEF)-like protein
MPPLIRLLLAEDLQADAELALRELKRAGLRVEHRLADTEPDFRAALADFAPQIILSDFSMPHFDGMFALQIARELVPQTPFIFVSGTIGEEYAIRALKNGATDYVLKSNLVRLPVAVERALDEARQRERLVRLGRIRDLLGASSASFMRNRERGALFDEFCRIAVSRGGFVLARVVQLDEAGRLFAAATTESGPGAFQAVIDEYNADPEGSPSLLAIGLRSGQAVISNDMQKDTRVRNRERLTRDGNYSLAILPVRTDGKVIGATILRAREVDFFDQEELALLGEMVANLEFALELLEKQERLDYLALYDPLTGLPNRTLFQDRLTQALDASRRGSTMLALTVFDLERFKAINDTLGQSAGDAVLRAVAQRLRDTVGDINHVARLGSDHFAVMQPALQDASDAARLIEDKSKVVFGDPVQIDGREIRISAKAGIAVFPDDGMDAAALFRNAEASLKRAKETGERYMFYAPHINARVSEQVELEGRLRRAVEQRELFMHFQPKVRLADRRIVGVEALMRWRGADGQLVPPVRFVPVLEETGLILEAGRIAFECAAAAYRGWRAEGLEAPRVAVNISALQIRQRDFVEAVQSAVGGNGADSGVDVEITESLLMQDVEDSIRKLQALREMGLRIALDDFGTGHSSLAYLSRLPLDTLKIDRSFVNGMTENAGDTSIVTAIISLAQALRLSVVAEGVETEAQAQLLRLLRCDQMQGYLFSKPVTQEEIGAMLRTSRPA